MKLYLACSCLILYCWWEPAYLGYLRDPLSLPSRRNNIEGRAIAASAVWFLQHMLDNSKNIIYNFKPLLTLIYSKTSKFIDKEGVEPTKKLRYKFTVYKIMLKYSNQCHCIPTREKHLWNKRKWNEVFMKIGKKRHFFFLEIYIFLYYQAYVVKVWKKKSFEPFLRLLKNRSRWKIYQKLQWRGPYEKV